MYSKICNLILRLKVDNKHSLKFFFTTIIRSKKRLKKYGKFFKSEFFVNSYFFEAFI